MSDIGKAIIRVPKITKGAVSTIQSLIKHPNDTGLIKDEKTGQIIPSFFIQSLKVEFEGEPVYEMKLAASVSKDPYFAYSLKVDKPGKLKMTWTDNKGAVYEQTADINPA